jgi:hypothetical protein
MAGQTNQIRGSDGLELRKKLFIIVTLSIGILVIVIPISIFVFIKINLYSLQKATTHYLLFDKGLEKTSIMSIKPVFGKAPIFSVRVIFKDEPDNIYYYFKKENGQVFQHSHSSSSIDNNNKYKYVEK